MPNNGRAGLFCDANQRGVAGESSSVIAGMRMRHRPVEFDRALRRETKL